MAEEEINKDIEKSVNLQNEDLNNAKALCSNCGKEIEPNVKFCPFCGAENTEKQNEFVKPIKEKKPHNWFMTLVKIVFLIVLIGGALFAWNYYEEQEKLAQMSQPYSTTNTYGDTPCNISFEYSKETQNSNVKMVCDEVIEDWQINALRNQAPDIEIVVESGNEVLYKLIPNEVIFEKGKKLGGNYKIPNISIQEYYNHVQQFKYNSTYVNTTTIVSLDKKAREKEKQKYYAEIRRQAEAKRQAEQEQKQLEAMQNGLMGLMMFGGY